MSWPNDEQRAALGPSHWEHFVEKDRAIREGDERAARDGAEAEARALAWAHTPIGTPYGDVDPWGSGAVPDPLYQLDGARNPR